MRRFVTALAFCAFGAGAAQADDCKMKLFDTIPLTVANDQILLPVKIGDVQKEFALEFSAASNAISEELATELDLKFLRMNPNVNEVYGGVSISRLVRVPQFQVGDLPFRNADLLVLPSAGNPHGFAGDIGVRLFSRADVELDIAGKKLRVFSQDCPGVYWTSTPHVEIPLIWQQDAGYVRATMQLEGKPVRVALDPNAQSSIGMNAMRRLFGLDANSPGMTPAGEDARGRKLFHYPFKALAAEGLSVFNPAIVVIDQPPSDEKCDDHPTLKTVGSALDPAFTVCQGGADIVLGYSVLSKLHMYFAIKEKVLYLTGADAR